MYFENTLVSKVKENFAEPSEENIVHFPFSLCYVYSG